MPGQRPEAVANEFLKRAGDGGLTQMQLQKLVYIAHGWALAYSGQPLTNIEPEAWDRGPVYPELRSRISHIGSRPLRDLIRQNDDNPFAVRASEGRGAVIRGKFAPYETQIIDRVWNGYGALHGFTLSNMTHQAGTPWHETYHGRGRNTPILNTATEAYYLDLARKQAEKGAAGETSAQQSGQQPVA